jgi:hypothetical protein
VPRGGITVFRSPKKPEPGAAPSKKPDRPKPNEPSASEADVAKKSAKKASNVPTPESPVPRPRPIGSKRPPPSPTLPVTNAGGDADDAPARRPAPSANDANANDDATRVISEPTTRRKEIDDAPEDVPSPGPAPVSPLQQQQKKKKKKGGDPEKAARAAHYAAVNAAHAADAAAAARALRGRLDRAKKDRETDSDLAEQTRAQLEMLLSERARASTTIATLQRERDAAEDLLAHQNVALDEAEATIERLRAELREAREKTGGKTDGDAETEARRGGDDDGEHGDASAAAERDGEVRSERDAYQVVSP